MDSPLAVNAEAVRREALQRAQAELARAQSTEKKHYARLALARAKRAVS